jgi:hypothetical protein
MRIEQFIQIGLGASLGALAGFALSRAKTCSGEQCRTRPVTWYAVLAGAVFGAVAGWVLISQG